MVRKSLREYAVGDKVGCGTIIDIHLETGNNYALVKCDFCGLVTKSNANRLNSNRNCRCQKTKGLEKAAKERSCEAINGIRLYQVFGSRMVIEIKTNKHGRTVALMKCLNPDCEKETEVPMSDVRLGIDCSCQGFSKAQDTLEKNFGKRHMGQVPEIFEKSVASRIAKSNGNAFRSNGEISIQQYIEELGLTCKHHSCGVNEIDVYVESKSIGIEFNGDYWHSEIRNPDRRRHLKKKEAVAKSGIDLIQIWEHQWAKRQQQVKNYLKARLGCNKNRIGVRKCLVTTISKAEAVRFIEEHHIQGGHVDVMLAIGAYHEGELIAVATFCLHHRGTGTITLNRLCSKYDWTCSGFLGKAIRVAYKVLKKPIYSWVDRCLSEGKSYLSAGFVVDATLPPDYFYVSRKCLVIKKQSFRKIDERTEAQRASDEGLHKIWDCGKIRFVFNPLARPSKTS